MSMAWETTYEDVYSVLVQIDGAGNEDATEKLAREAFDQLDPADHERIEKAALWGDEMEEQVEYAHDEIKKILEERGILKGMVK